jgi:response regulator NasT
MPRRLKILVAEDDPVIRLGLKSYLAHLGHDAFLAANGREALNLVRSTALDMALLDIQMPMTDGLEAAKTIARKYPMPMIIITAYSEKDLIEKAAQLPIQGYLIKPVNERDLAAAIPIALARYEETQALTREKAELEESLETRKLVDRAKGKLMQGGLSEEDAYLTIQRQAREGRMTMKQAAEAILSA